MNRGLALLFLLCFTAVWCQNPPIDFDGVVDPVEWQTAQHFTIDYEIDPGDNAPAPFATNAYVTYDDAFLYIGFVAEADMPNLRSSIRNRDEGFRDDNVMFGFDTYGDGRYMIALGTNPEGNQIDIKVLSNGDDENYDVNFLSKASKHPTAYHVELKIPFSNLQFKAQEEMRWKVIFIRNTFTATNESLNINFPIDRNNPCLICQSPAEIVLKGIQPKNRVNLLPFVFGGWSGDRAETDFDFQSPLGSICQYRFTDLTDYGPQRHFLKPDSVHTNRLRQRYYDGRPLVGISWQGGGKANRIALKSLNLKQMTPLLERSDCRFVSLQYGDDGPHLERYKKATGIEVLHDNAIDPLRDMDGWLNQVAAMDAVISIANTTVHGAGGLGVPTLCLVSQQSDWRWIDPEVYRGCYWYPSVDALYQEKESNWQPALSEASNWMQRNLPKLINA